MTLLVGALSSADYREMDGSGVCVYSSFVAEATGLATTMSCELHTTIEDTHLKMAIYSADGLTKLGETEEITASGGGVKTANLTSGVPIVDGTSYYLVLIWDTDVLFVRGDGSGYNSSWKATAGYPAFPSDVASGGEGFDPGFLSIVAEGTTGSVEQEGFRYRNDDGSETTATWKASQDTNVSVAPTSNVRLRMLLNATADLAAAAFRLEWKQGAGAWSQVPIGASTAQPMPTFVAAGASQSAVNAVSPAWPAHQVNDVALLVVETCGGETAALSTAAGFAPVDGSPWNTGTTTNGTRLSLFWCRATSSGMSAPTIADSGNHQYARILTFRGCIASGNPWDVVSGGVKAAASTTTTFGSVTTTVANALVVNIATRDDDSAAAAWSAWTNANLSSLTEIADEGTTQGNGGGIGVAAGGLAAAGSSGATTATVTSSVDAHVTIALRPPAPVLNEIYIAPSANIAAGGVATTAQLTPPSGKTTGDFFTGRMWDDENGSDSVDLGADDYTELEWCLQLGTPSGGTYDLRVTNAGTPLSTYSVTPQLTLLGGGTASGSGVTINVTAPTGSAIGYGQVVLIDPMYTGPGSIVASSNFIGTPMGGDVVRFPTNANFAVLSDGSIQCDSNTGSFVCYYNDGTGEVAFTVTLDNTAYAAGPGVTNTVSAPSGSAAGAAQATGPGVTNTTAAPAGDGHGAAQGTGAGFTETTTGPSGSAAGAAQAAGPGATVTVTPPAGSASGGSAANATGPGVTNTVIPPAGSAVGGANVSAPGVTNTVSAPVGSAGGAAEANGPGTTVAATPPNGSAVGDSLGAGPGVTVSVSAPDGDAEGGAEVSVPGVTQTITAPDGAAAGSALGTGPGATIAVNTPAGSAASVLPGNATGAGVEITVQDPAGSATGAASAPSEGFVVEVSEPEVSGHGAAEVSAEGFTARAALVPKGFSTSIENPVYASAADMLKRFGATELAQLTNQAKDEASDIIDDVVLQAAMADADVEINGYLAGRYQLPLSNIPPLLQKLACDIARYNLFADRVTDHVQKRYDDAIKFLTAVSVGKIALGIDQAGVAPAAAGGPTASTSDRVFTDSSLSDFRGDT